MPIHSEPQRSFLGRATHAYSVLRDVGLTRPRYVSSMVRAVVQGGPGAVITAMGGAHLRGDDTYMIDDAGATSFASTFACRARSAAPSSMWSSCWCEHRPEACCRWARPSLLLVVSSPFALNPLWITPGIMPLVAQGVHFGLITQ